MPKTADRSKPGLFIPYRYADQLPDPARLPRYDEIAALFDAGANRFTLCLDGLDAQAEALRAIPVDGHAPAARWRQDWFPRLDAAIYYSLIRQRRPKRIIEIGSGHSTRFAARAAADMRSLGETPPEIIALDPYPRAPLPADLVTHIPALLHQADDGVFTQLEAGDMLFIDSSHISAPGTDVDQLFSRILPRLSAGTIVHIHDICLPDPYPAEWTWRGYNEQQVVAALLNGGGWRPIFSSRHARTAHSERLEASVIAEIPINEGAFETSLWLEKAH